MRQINVLYVPMAVFHISREAERAKKLRNMYLHFKKTGLFALVLFAWFYTALPSEAKTLKIIVTTPWLASITSFIGGVNVKVIPMSKIGQRGKLIKVKLLKEQRQLPSIALDREEASYYGLESDSERVRILYSNFPVSQDRDTFFSDPSILPFVTQRVLVALASYDPDRYWYYQRRLAEFQGRLETTLSLGRKLLMGGKILDIAGESEMLFKAGGCVVSCPTEDMIKSMGILVKSRGKKEDIKKILESWLSGVDVILIGYTVDRRIREAALKIPQVVFYDPPGPDSDFISDLYNYYLSVWNVLRNRENRL